VQVVYLTSAPHFLSLARFYEIIERLLEWFIEFFKTKDYAYGCPIGNLAQEMGDLSPAFREKLQSALDILVDTYSDMLARAQKEGEISRDPEADGLFGFLFPLGRRQTDARYRHPFHFLRPFYPVKCPFLFYFTGASLVILHSSFFIPKPPSTFQQGLQ